jgi:putative MFS transporter
VSAACASLVINALLARGGTPAVASFIAAAMVVMTVTIGGFGPKTRRLALEEISR